MSIRLALAGNPNCGKTTMFNDLTGATQYVGNWPGVTVEKKEGKFKGDKEVLITDLPGIYSLSPYTLEEVVARDYLVNEKPQAIMNLVDASNIERNLYLTTQLLEMGIPVVIALNMMDIVKKRGDVIDVKKLSQELGVPVVETAAIKGEGTKELVEAAKKAAKAGNAPAKRAFEGTIENAVTEIEKLIADVTEPAQRRWFAVKLFERDSKVQARFTLGKDVQDKIEKLITAVEEELDDDAESIITDARYQYIGKLVKDCVKKKKTGLSTSDKIDHIVTNRILALPIFALIMWLVYYVSVSTAGGIFTDWANDGVFGDGWHLFTIGAADYEEATAEYDDQITRRDAWLEAADEAGIDTSALTEQLEAEEADETAIADAAAAIEADPAAASVVGTAEFEDEDSGKVTTENVDLATFEQTLTAAEPDPADFGVWVPGIPVLLEKLFASMGVNEDGWVYSLVMDGIVAGVGAVLGFVPQMLILFFFLAILEDCGYMARVADIVKKRGDVIDVKKLSQELGVPVVETAAIKGEGTKELVEAAKKAAKAGNAPAKRAFEGTIENAVTEIEKLIADVTEPAQRRWFAVKLFERDSKVQARFTLGKDVQDKIEKLITAVEEELDDDAESIITDARYQYIGKLVKDCVKKKKTGLSTSDKIDHIVTNRILALPIFALIMWLVYYVSVSTAGGIFTDWANDGVFGDGWHLFTIAGCRIGCRHCRV